MPRKRPIGITLLAILSALAAVSASLYALQLLGVLPFTIGNIQFFTPESGWIGAILWALLGLIYIWVARLLWIVDPRGWTFVVLISAIGLILALISIIGDSSWQSMLPTILFDGLILIYCFLPSTKEAFVVKQ